MADLTTDREWTLQTQDFDLKKQEIALRCQKIELRLRAIAALETLAHAIQAAFEE